MWPLLAFLVSIAVSVLLLLVTFKEIDLTVAGAYSGRQRAIYAVVCTTIASLLTSFIKTQTRHLWILHVDANFSQKRNLSDLRKINRKWRTILDVSTLREILDNWHVQATFLGTTLVTTAIVAGLTPTLTTRNLASLHITASSARLYQGSNCVSFATFENQSSYYYQWATEDGNYVVTNPAGGGCPSRQAVTLMGNINIRDPTSYAYSDTGVAISPTAIGVPIAAYASQADIAPDLNHAIEKYGSALQSVSLCAPVMKKSPVSCRVGGTMNVYDYALAATSDDGLCSWVSNSTFFNPITTNMMAKGLCTHGNIGQATIILAGTDSYAYWLATAIGDTSLGGRNQTGSLHGARFVVTCDVDTRDVYEFRNVTLRLQNPDPSVSAAFGRTLAATPDASPCQPPADYGPDIGLLAIAAVSSWQPLLQNEGSDGWFDSIGQYAIGFSDGERRQPSWAFSNSQNALDDVFGLVAALVGSRMNSTSKVRIPIQVSGTSTRVGTGHLWALLFSLPPLFAAGVILWLLLSTSKKPHMKTSTINLEDLLNERINYNEHDEDVPLKNLARPHLSY